MRGLLTLVIAMGVLIVAGVVVIGVTLVHRLGRVAIIPQAPFQVVLDEPAGTRIAGTAAWGDRLGVTLQGGGPDRIVILNGEGRQIGYMRLAK